MPTNLTRPSRPPRLYRLMFGTFPRLGAANFKVTFATFLFLGGILEACGPSGETDPGDPSTGGSANSGGSLSGSGGEANSGGVNGSGGAASGSGGMPTGSGGLTSGSGGMGPSSGGADPGTGGATSGDGGASASGGSPSGGQAGFSTNRDDFGLGMPSLCTGGFTVCEDFEDTAVGGIPAGLTLGGYGNRTLGVTESQSARGARSLQIDVNAGQSAVVAMLSVGNVSSLSAAHFGRMFYRIEGPGVSEFVHFDVLEAQGPWMDHQNGVRFASTGTGVGSAQGNWSWIYNVQPFDGGGAEFGSEGDRSAHPVVDEWMCLEWAFDSAEQTATYYHDGAPIDYLVIDDERSEIPVFSSIQVGFQKFQSTGAFRVFIDELALHTERVGCNY